MNICSVLTRPACKHDWAVLREGDGILIEPLRHVTTGMPCSNVPCACPMCFNFFICAHKMPDEHREQLPEMALGALPQTGDAGPIH